MCVEGGLHAVYSHWYHLDKAGVSCILYAANLLLGGATGCGHQNPSKTDIVHWSTPHMWRVQFGSATNKNRKSNAFMSAVQIIKKKKTASQVTTYEQGCPSKNSQLDHSLVRLSRDTKIMSATAQRPNDKTLCDYYALLLYGANSSVTQFYLIQEIVTLAFIGGSSLPNASQSLTGILNPGTFLNTSVDLGGFFNASLLSSNVNNGPAAVNWLDGGGTQPLVDFVSGKTANLTLANTTNE